MVEEPKITAYHYTNPKAFQSMKTPGKDGWITFTFDDFKGLIPGKRFLRLDRGEGLPKKAYDDVIEGLLEPEPSSWLNNPNFPDLWKYLMGDICRENILLLSFSLVPSDEAYVVDRVHMERELYKRRENSTRKSMNEAVRKYWESRIPVFAYNGGYTLPQLSIWSPIEFDRLNIEWIRSREKFWNDLERKVA